MNLKCITKLSFFLCFIYAAASGQCTEEKDADMAKYKRLTETQDAQGCSQCAMLALYLCLAESAVEMEDKRAIAATINATKGNIKNMGDPICCPELLTREPKWGIKASQNNTTTNNSNLNGSANSNEVLAYTAAAVAAIEIGKEVANVIKEVKDFKNSYSASVEITKKNLNQENEPALNSALLESFLGKKLSPIPNIYKYDLYNGSKLYVEDGILKWRSKDGSIIHNFFYAEESNDGTTKAQNTTYFNSNIKLVNNEEFIILNYYSTVVPSSYKCSFCIDEGNYILNTETGKIWEFKGSNSFDFAINNFIEIDSTGIYFLGWNKNKEIGVWKIQVDKKKPFYVKGNIKLDYKPFIINNKKIKNYSGMIQYLYNDIYIALLHGSDPVWNGDSYTHKAIGTQFYITNYEGTKFSSRDFFNDITSILLSSKGVLYYTTAKGSLYNIDLNMYNDPQLIAFNIFNNLKSEKPLLPEYNFIEDYTKPDLIVRPLESSKIYGQYRLPNLSFSPEEQFLIYTSKNYLAIIDLKQINKIKTLTLDHEIINSYFTKEDDRSVFYIQTINQFGLPITKKYDFNKLVN